MAQEVLFISKYRRFRTYNGKAPIQFEGNEYRTSDPKEIEILEKMDHITKVPPPVESQSAKPPVSPPESPPPGNPPKISK